MNLGVCKCCLRVMLTNAHTLTLKTTSDYLKTRTELLWPSCSSYAAPMTLKSNRWSEWKNASQPLRKTSPWPRSKARELWWEQTILSRLGAWPQFTRHQARFNIKQLGASRGQTKWTFSSIERLSNLSEAVLLVTLEEGIHWLEGVEAAVIVARVELVFPTRSLLVSSCRTNNRWQDPTSLRELADKV